MPKHQPIKFEPTLELSFKKHVTRFLKENKVARSTLNATLAIIAMGGVLTIASVAPGLLKLAGTILKKEKRQHHEEYHKIWKNFYKLKTKKDLEFVKKEGGYQVYRLSNKGKEKMEKFIFDEITLAEPKTWDKKWRLVIFDIPESRKKERWALRNKLKSLNFYQCQKSVWLHPFPCLEEIEFLTTSLNIKPFVKLFTVDEMTDGKTLYYFRDLLKSVFRITP